MSIKTLCPPETTTILAPSGGADWADASGSTVSCHGEQGTGVDLRDWAL